ncbi:MAG: hypothetical protein PVI30_08580 [Myxococcales bacterium]
MPLRTGLPAAALLLLGAGCATVDPPPLVRAAPRGPHRWLQGRQLATITTDPVYLVVGFEADRGSHTEWIVWVENRSDHDVFVTPASFHYRVAGATRRTPDRWVTALDPSEAIADLDRHSARREAAYQETRKNEFGEHLGMSFLEGLLGLERESAHDAAERRRSRTIIHQNQRAALERRRAMLADEALRRTTLAPGEGVGGRLFFPRLEHDGPTEVVLWDYGLMIRFPFQQHLEVTAEARRARQRSPRARFRRR